MILKINNIENLQSLFENHGFEFVKAFKNKKGRLFFLFRFKENEKLLVSVKVKNDTYKFIFAGFREETNKNDTKTIENIINRIKQVCKKITYEKLNLMGIDVGNLYPVSIVKFDVSLNKITGIQVDVKDKMFIQTERLIDYFNMYNSEERDKFGLLKNKILPLILKVNEGDNLKFKILKKIVDEIFEKHIRNFDGIIILGNVNFFDNVRKLIRSAKENKQIKAPSPFKAYQNFKKFCTFIFTSFVSRYLKRLLIIENKYFLIVDETETSNYFYDFLVKNIDTNKKMIIIKNYAYCLNSDFLACINMMRINKYFDKVVRKRIENIKNLKLFDGEIVYDFDLNKFRLNLKSTI